MFSLSTGLIVGKLKVMLVKRRYGTATRSSSCDPIYTTHLRVVACPREPEKHNLAKRANRGIACDTSVTTHQHQHHQASEFW